MDSLGTLCIIGFIALIALFILPRLLGGLGGGRRGPLNPTYDDPNIEGSGSFGGQSGTGSERPSFDDPNIQGHGSFGRSQNRSFFPRRSGGSSGASSSGRADNPNVRGRGGFGRSK